VGIFHLQTFVFIARCEAITCDSLSAHFAFARTVHAKLVIYSQDFTKVAIYNQLSIESITYIDIWCNFHYHSVINSLVTNPKKETIMNKKIIAIALASFFLTPVAYADKHDKGAIDNCVKAALAKFPGKLASVRAEIEDGKA